MANRISTNSLLDQFETDHERFELEPLEPRLLLSADPLGTQVAVDPGIFQPDRESTGAAIDADSVTAFISALDVPHQDSADMTRALPASLDLDAVDTTSPTDNDSVLDYLAATSESLPGSDQDHSISTRHEVIFVDTRTPDYETLLADVHQRDNGIGYDIIMLDADTDGIDQISDVLNAYHDLDAVHIISHAGADAVQLGGTWLQSANFDQYAARIAGWQDHLGSEADLLFYGCNLAGSETGKALIDQLSQLTGADVAASDDLTGWDGLGGDWTLEHQVGDIETRIAVSDTAQQQWMAVLVDYVSETSSNMSAAFDSANAFGQTFVHNSGSGTYDVDYIGLELDRDGAASGTITVTLRDGWDGNIFASATRDASTLNENPTLEIFHFAPVPLNDFQFYTIQVEVGPSSGTLNYGYDNTNPYFWGVLLQNGAADFASDLAFEVGFASGTPILTASTLDLAQGDVVAIDSTNLAATDIDSADGSLLFNISSVSHGHFAYAADTSTAITSFTQDDITAGDIRFVHDGGELAPVFDVSVSDGSLATAASTATVNFTGTAKGVLWFSTNGNVGTGSGIPGLNATDIKDHHVLQQADPNFSLGEGVTNGTFSVAFNASDFAGNEDTKGLHYVTGTTTIGSTNAITLQAGDLLLTNRDAATFNSNGTGAPAPLAVTNNDIFFFRPDTPGDYSTGNFYMLLSDPFGDGSRVSAITLVERDVSVGGTDLSSGDILLSSADIGRDRSIWLLGTSTLDPTVSASYPAIEELIDGADAGVDFDRNIVGLDIFEQDTTIGGNSYDAGTLLVSFRADDADGVGTTAKVVGQHDIAALTVTKTSLETPLGNAQLSASIMFDGDNVSLNSPEEDIDGFTLTPDISSTNLAPILGSNNLVVTEGATVTITNVMLSASDVDSADPGLVFNVSSVNGGQFELSTDPGVGVVSFTQGQILSSEVVFVDDGDENPPSFDVNVSDGTNTTTDVSGVVTFISTNDAPTATNLDSTSSYNEGDASVAITDIVVSDVDAGETITATLTLANTATGSLSANDGASYNAGSGVWSISDTVANVNTALANLVFTPAINNEVDTTISVVIDDGDEDASGPLTGTITLDVMPVNDLPTSADSSVATVENVAISFASSDFAYADVETSGIVALRIDSLPGNGVLANGAVVLNAGDVVLAADLGNLTYTPNTNYNGADSFDFSVSDGTDFSISPNTMTITVSAVNSLPTSMDIGASADEDTIRTFAATDFPFADVESASIVALRIDSLPVNGVLTNGATVVNAGDVILAADLDQLRFMPAAEFNGTDSFGFSVFDGSDYSAAPNTMTITVNAINDVPTSGDFSISTIEDVASTFAAADFPFADVESAGIVALRIDAIPGNGTLMNGTTVLNAGDIILAADLANLSYTPDAGFNGSDSFSFSVSDGTAYSATSSTVTANVSPAAVIAAVAESTIEPIVVETADAPLMDPEVKADAVETAEAEVDTVSEDVTDDATEAQNEPVQAPVTPEILVDAGDAGIPENAVTPPDYDSNQRIDVDTGVKVSLQGLLQAIQIQLPGWDNLQLSAGEMFDPMNMLESDQFNRDMDQLREEAQEDVVSQKMKAGSGVVLTSSLTIGYVAYLVRGGVLLSSVLSALPVWNFIDPTPILASVKSSGDDDKDDEDDDSLESLVTQHEPVTEVEALEPDREADV